MYEYRGVSMRLIIMSLIFFSQVTFAAEQGVFMVVKGKVKVDTGKSITEVKVGAKVQVGDVVITDKDSRAKIVMSDRNIINVSPETKFKIEKYSNTKDDKNVKINLIEGKIRNNVEQSYDNKNSKFEVKTATAVAGVRGTQFITSYDKKTKATEVITLKGQVYFQKIGGASEGPQSDPVIVNKGEKSEVNETAAAPAPPAKVPEKDMKQIDTDTSVKAEKKDDPNKGPRENAAGGPPPPANTLINMQEQNKQLIEGEATKKFEKSKVKIITQPN